MKTSRVERTNGRLGSIVVLSAGLALGATLVGTGAGAQDTGRRPPGGGPPQAAITACSGRSSGASCSFTDTHGPSGSSSVSGHCFTPSSDHPLACRPDHGPGAAGGGGGHPHGPPPEAYTACQDVAVGDACVVDTPHGTLEGTCRTIQSRTACVPNDMPAPPSSGT